MLRAGAFEASTCFSEIQQLKHHLGSRKRRWSPVKQTCCPQPDWRPRWRNWRRTIWSWNSTSWRFRVKSMGHDWLPSTWTRNLLAGGCLDMGRKCGVSPEGKVCVWPSATVLNTHRDLQQGGKLFCRRSSWMVQLPIHRAKLGCRASCCHGRVGLPSYSAVSGGVSAVCSEALIASFIFLLVNHLFTSDQPIWLFQLAGAQYHSLTCPWAILPRHRCYWLQLINQCRSAGSLSQEGFPPQLPIHFTEAVLCGKLTAKSASWEFSNPSIISKLQNEN